MSSEAWAVIALCVMGAVSMTAIPVSNAYVKAECYKAAQVNPNIRCDATTSHEGEKNGE